MMWSQCTVVALILVVFSLGSTSEIGLENDDAFSLGSTNEFGLENDEDIRWLQQAVSAGDGIGNHFCFDFPNVQGRPLSYDSCCTSLKAASECFDSFGSGFSHEFCCFEPPNTCNWDGVYRKMIKSCWNDQEILVVERLADTPMTMIDFCCFLADTGDDYHPCWFEDPDSDKSTTSFEACCFPVLHRRLGRRHDDLPWIQRELDREFAPLEGQRWTSEDLDAWEADFRPVDQESSLKPCRIQISNGVDISTCDLAEACSGPEHNDCSYIKAVQAALDIIVHIQPLPDVEFLVSPSNRDQTTTSVPVFTRHRPKDPRGLYVLFPAEWQLHPLQMRKNTVLANRRSQDVSWFQREDTLVWRGTNSNCFQSCRMTKVTRGEISWKSCLENWTCAEWNLSNWYGTPRGRLLFLGQYLDGLDARLSGISHPMDSKLWDYFVENGFTGERIDHFGHVNRKYAIDIDGTGNGDRILFHLNAGNLVFNVDSPMVSWLLGDIFDSVNSTLKPFVHYVPVLYDLSDFAEKFDQYRKEQQLAETIARIGSKFAKWHVTYEHVLLYLDRAVRRYAENHFANVSKRK